MLIKSVFGPFHCLSSFSFHHQPPVSKPTINYLFISIKRHIFLHYASVTISCASWWSPCVSRAHCHGDLSPSSSSGTRTWTCASCPCLHAPPGRACRATVRART